MLLIVFFYKRIVSPDFVNSLLLIICIGDGDSQLSTSTVDSPQGVILNQYGVLVSGLSVCLNSNTVFYVDLTGSADDVMSESANQRDGIISARSILDDVSKVLENTCSSKVSGSMALKCRCLCLYML